MLHSSEPSAQTPPASPSFFGRRRPQYGWAIVVGVMVITFVGFGANWYAQGAFFSPIVAEFGWGRGAFSIATSLYMALSTLAAWPAGRLVDRYGARKVILGFSLLNGLCWILIGQVGRHSQDGALWQMYVLFALMGVATAGIGPVPTTTLIARWFQKQRGLAMGISAVGFGLPGVILLPLAAPLIATHGWRPLAVGLGAMCIVGCVIMALWVLREPPPLEGPGEAHVRGATGFRASEAVRTPGFWLLSGALLLRDFGTNAAQLHAMPFMTDQGISTKMAATIWGSLAFAGIVGKLAVGVIGDRVSSKVLLILTTLSQVTALVLAIFWHGIAGAWAFSILLGLGMGGQMVVRPLLIQDCFGLCQFATISGVITLLSIPGNASSQPLAGYLYDATGSYTLAFSVFSTAMVMAMVLLLPLKRTHHERQRASAGLQAEVSR